MMARPRSTRLGVYTTNPAPSVPGMALKMRVRRRKCCGLFGFCFRQPTDKRALRIAYSARHNLRSSVNSAGCHCPHGETLVAELGGVSWRGINTGAVRCTYRVFH